MGSMPARTRITISSRPGRSDIAVPSCGNVAGATRRITSNWDCPATTVGRVVAPRRPLRTNQ
eukprot:8606354-Alexandrium_andersonii.AAC.1